MYTDRVLTRSWQIWWHNPSLSPGTKYYILFRTRSHKIKSPTSQPISISPICIHKSLNIKSFPYSINKYRVIVAPAGAQSRWQWMVNTVYCYASVDDSSSTIALDTTLYIELYYIYGVNIHWNCDITWCPKNYDLSKSKKVWICEIYN
jgi:hypothetical protein